MYGVDAFTPNINSPRAGILGINRLRDDVRWVDNRPERTPVMRLSLNWEHRVLDGAPGDTLPRRGRPGGAVSAAGVSVAGSAATDERLFLSDRLAQSLAVQLMEVSQLQFVVIPQPQMLPGGSL